MISTIPHTPSISIRWQIDPDQPYYPSKNVVPYTLKANTIGKVVGRCSCRLVLGMKTFGCEENDRGESV